MIFKMALIQVLKEYSISQRSLARAAGVCEVALSRSLAGGDALISTYDALVKALPPEARNRYFQILPYYLGVPDVPRERQNKKRGRKPQKTKGSLVAPNL